MTCLCSLSVFIGSFDLPLGWFCHTNLATLTVQSLFLFVCTLCRTSVLPALSSAWKYTDLKAYASENLLSIKRSCQLLFFSEDGSLYCQLKFTVTVYSKSESQQEVSNIHRNFSYQSTKIHLYIVCKKRATLPAHRQVIICCLKY